jgi:hypothetical protein
MKTATTGPQAEAEIAPDALIREARRRQRQRYLVNSLAAIAVGASTAALFASAGTGGHQRHANHRANSAAVTHANAATRSHGLLLDGAATTVVLWPVGFPAFGPGSAPRAYTGDLATGQFVQRTIPAIAGGDFQPYAMAAGARLVYVGSGGTMAIPASLTGKPKMLGPTPFFAPSAVASRVWLVHYRDYVDGGPVYARQVPVGGGLGGPAITLPAGTALVLRGTDAGFLLEVRVRTRYQLGLRLWRPGSAPRNLPHLFAGSGDAPISIGFDATPRLVAYGTGCRLSETGANAPVDPSMGYQTCPMLRVLDVVTGRLVSVAAPAATTGWIPNGFNTVSATSPDGQMIAAYAATRPHEGRVRLYVIRLGTGRAAAVPSSAGSMYAKTAWSVNSAWLLYQGRGRHLWAYEVTSGKTRASGTPCCLYTAMVATKSQPSSSRR